MICELEECDHYACGLRRKGLQISPRATPSRVNNRHQPFRAQSEPSFEKGLVGERRVDGSFMPVLVPGTDRPMGLHEAMGQRSKIDEGIRALKSDPNVFSKAGSP